MIYFFANIRSARATTDDALTTSSVGIPVTLRLDTEFEGLAKTIVFKAGGETVDIALVGDATDTVVPPDVLTTSGQHLFIGVYAANGSGTIVIPTVWADVGIIQNGTVPSGVDPSDPTPNWVAQVQGIASEANENASDAVEIANGVKERADAGEFNGEDGDDGVSPAVTISSVAGGHRVSVTDASGTQTFDVMDGEEGPPGEDGKDGDTGPQGPAGVGVPSGGTTGQVLKKKSGTDYDTEWEDTAIPTKTSDLTNDSGFITAADVPSEVFWATYGTTTNAEIEAAYQAGKECLCVYTNALDSKQVFRLSERTSANIHSFTACKATAAGTDTVQCYYNLWRVFVNPAIPYPSAAGTEGQVLTLDSNLDPVWGTPGGGGVTVDSALSDSSTNPVQNKVIKSALDAKGTYSKPSGGIPKSDLASAVQTSLGKADTALQSVPSTYRTAAAQDVIDAGKIAAPSSPATGAFLVWDGTAWVAQTLSTWSGGSY